MSAPTLLQKAAALLKQARPQDWERFISELERAEYELQVALTKAPAAEIMGVQGRCQQMAAVLRELKGIPT